MTYVIVTRKNTVVSEPFASFQSALVEAIRLFGDDIVKWMELNIRVEETR